MTLPPFHFNDILYYYPTLILSITGHLHIGLDV
jgi:hypothetical protein